MKKNVISVTLACLMLLVMAGSAFSGTDVPLPAQVVIKSPLTGASKIQNLNFGELVTRTNAQTVIFDAEPIVPVAANSAASPSAGYGAATLKVDGATVTPSGASANKPTIGEIDLEFGIFGMKLQVAIKGGTFDLTGQTTGETITVNELKTNVSKINLLTTIDSTNPHTTLSVGASITVKGGASFDTFKGDIPVEITVI
ncbi:DUF4402 domain-containing protein [Desulfovibrio sp. JC010]|uniref:DUF4402 domain-containing protein n=1 Tax=Desulfovibrio sp. JC010 TaxID=2593641 RepID=UPI0013D4F88B|nr:DUF4402 domain-containing protein [Desulfovibrio sp. JC010]NDV26872.1 hypothetical protein [Desulfovibrio sp. JC010]